jgi:SPASM domain peptide maturase of grasp-with-spasm system
MNSNKVFKLFASIIPVRGFCRSVLFDLNRNQYEFIPNSLFQLIKEYEGKFFNEVLLTFEKSEHLIIFEYFNFLERKEYIYWCDKEELNFYPKLNLCWDNSAKITNAVIQWEETSEWIIREIILDLEGLGCKHIQIYSENRIKRESVILIIELFKDSAFLSVELIEKYHRDFKKEEYIDIIRKYPRIKSIVLYSAPYDRVFTKSTIGALGNLVCTKKPANLELKDRAFGIFSINIEIFTEAQKHNLYFNRKLAIDNHGNFKNHLKSSRSFGNLKTNKISDVLQNNEFTKPWFISKELIEVCKDCEFRYVCVDDRLDLIKTQSGYSYNSECQYNPYIAKHNKQEGYITVKEWQEQQKTTTTT